MWKFVILVVLVSGFAEGCRYKDGSECPDYTVVEEHADYEIRSYPALTWATTTEETHLPRIGKYKNFRKLFNYISGQNDQGLKINMTVPVRMTSFRDGDKTVFGMSFMLPAEVAEHAPVPNDKTISISRENPTLYAVREFKGYVWREQTWTEEASKLAESLKNDDTFIKTSYFQVGYDAPFDLFDRRNEIWMVKSHNELSNQV